MLHKILSFRISPKTTILLLITMFIVNVLILFAGIYIVLKGDAPGWVYILVQFWLPLVLGQIALIAHLGSTPSSGQRNKSVKLTTVRIKKVNLN